MVHNVIVIAHKCNLSNGFKIVHVYCMWIYDYITIF